MTQPYLFSTYPHRAGHKGTDTGKAAAKKVERGGKAMALRNRILLTLSFAAVEEKPMTADELAAHLGEDVLSILPRVTELLAKGLLLDTGLRRASSRGNMQRVVKAI